jgi:hypothetical protein
MKMEGFCGQAMPFLMGVFGEYGLKKGGSLYANLSSLGKPNIFAAGYFGRRTYFPF